MGLFGFGKIKSDDVVRKGTVATGRIVGIYIHETSGGEGSPDIRLDDYAVEVRAMPTFVAGMRQQLDPDDVVRLGMEVTVRHFEGHAVIDWPASHPGGTGMTAHLLKTPPPIGISDDTIGLGKAKKKGVPGAATITEVGTRSAMFGLASVLRAELIVAPEGSESYTLEVDKIEVPHYATHLFAVGRTVPCWVRLERLDRVTIDWPAAAMADPGIGVPPAAVLADTGNVFSGSEGAPTSSSAGSGGFEPIAAPGDADLAGGISFDQWVAVQAGIMRDRVRPGDADGYAQQLGLAPGAWATGEAAWQQRMRSDWRIGAAFGEAIEAAKKRNG